MRPSLLPDIYCRPDFFSCKLILTCDISQSDVVPGFKIDHSMITLTVFLHSNPTERKWLLEIEHEIEQVKVTIQHTADEYKENDSVNRAFFTLGDDQA